jgi:HCOMODA/2-hydroxy-3-carboxy-muconic semialdehyde decarboxylase
MVTADSTRNNAALIGQLVLANHILYERRVLDGFGHVSVRLPDQPDSFLLSRRMAPRLVTAQDILALDLEGNVISDEGRSSYVERFIHAEIYRVRSDVAAIVHSHSPAVIPFSVVKESALRPVCHMAGFLGERTPVYEIRHDVGEGSDLLIRTSELGASLARSLRQDSVILMRGHGSTVVGTSLPQAVFRAVYLELNARLQLDAMRLGAVTYLTPAEAAASSAAHDAQLERAWQLWVDEVAMTSP